MYRNVGCWGARGSVQGRSGMTTPANQRVSYRAHPRGQPPGLTRPVRPERQRVGYRERAYQPVALILEYALPELTGRMH